MNKQQYAIYSAKQAELAGTVEWLTPDGRTVLATAVSDSPGCPDTLLDDKQDLGPVTKFVRRVSGYCPQGAYY